MAATEVAMNRPLTLVTVDTQLLNLARFVQSHYGPDREAAFLQADRLLDQRLALTRPVPVRGL